MPMTGSLVGLAHAAELSGTAGSGQTILDLLRKLRPAVGSSNPLLARVDRYLTIIDAFDDARAGMDGRPLSLSVAARDSEREKLQALLKATGFNLNYRKGAAARVERATDRRAVEVRGALKDAGVDLDGIEERLNQGEAVDLTPTTTVLPLPMPKDWWERVIFRKPQTHLFHAILDDELASYLFYGFATLDGETRGYVASNSNVIRALCKAAPLFAAYGGSLRVREGAIDVPGGAPALAFWETLVGARVSRPDRFIESVLTSDNGRLAYFYDLIAHFDDPHIRFALRLSDTAKKQRSRQAVDAVYSWFGLPDDHWEPLYRPFIRPVYDGSLLLQALRVDESGRPARPNSRSLWSAVFSRDDIPLQPEKQIKGGNDQIVDSAFLLETAFIKDSLEPRRRVDTILFAQRVFRDTSDAPTLLVALRGFARFPVLHLTLERMGVTDPIVYAAAARRASTLSDIQLADTALASVTQLQGALALIERARFTGRIDVTTSTRLADSLLAVPLDRDGSYGAEIARWLRRDFVPSVKVEQPVGEEKSAEQQVLAGIAGLATLTPPESPDAQGPLVEWEGFQYRLNPSYGYYNRITKLRQRQGGNTLDNILQLDSAAEALKKEPQSVDELNAIVTNLSALTKVVQDVRPPPFSLTPLIDVQHTLSNVIRDGHKIGDKDLKNAPKLARRLEPVVAAVTADVLRAVVYATALGDSETPLLIDGDASIQHDFGVTQSTRQDRERVLWAISEQVGTNSEEQRGYNGKWHLKGSLLALDVALVPVTLRRVTAGLPVDIPAWGPQDVQAYISVVALFNPYRISPSSSETVADAVAAGRRRIDALAKAPASELEAVTREIHLGPTRRSLLSWVLIHDVANLRTFFSMDEALRLGGGETAVRAAEAWGGTGIPIDGCLCLQLQLRTDWDILSGHLGSLGYLGARSPDLLLRLAEWMYVLQLPPAVAADVLPAFVQTVLNESRPADSDDRAAITAFVERITRRAVEDRVSAITSGFSMFAYAAVVK